MKYEIGHMLMALSVISLTTIAVYMFGHLSGMEAYRMISAAAGTIAVTHFITSLLK